MSDDPDKKELIACLSLCTLAISALIDAFDVDPETTNITINIVNSDGTRKPFNTTTLADILKRTEKAL